MLKNKKLMVPVALAAFALIAISIFGIMELNKNGINGSKESNETMKEFNKYYNSKDKKIIYYASTSCYYCSLETPILEALAEDYDLDYYYVDTAKLNLSTRNEIMLQQINIQNSLLKMICYQKMLYILVRRILHS